MSFCKYSNSLLLNFRRTLSHTISSSSTMPLQSFKIIKVITQKDVDKYADVTGDHNPIHMSCQKLDKRFIHGSFINGIVSGIIGTKFPGPGTIVISQQFKFPNRCVIDKEIEIHVELLDSRKLMTIKYICTQMGLIVFEGTAKILVNKELSEN